MKVTGRYQRSREPVRVSKKQEEGTYLSGSMQSPVVAHRYHFKSVCVCGMRQHFAIQNLSVRECFLCVSISLGYFKCFSLKFYNFLHKHI